MQWGTMSLTRRGSLGSRGGRTWWAHRRFTRMNIGPTIPGHQVEELIVECTVIGGCIGGRAPEMLSGGLLRSPEVSGNRSACQEWWARWWALRTAVSRESHGHPSG